MKAISWIIAAVYVILIGTGCSKPLAPVYVGYQNLRLAKMGLSENIIATEVKLYNPNNYPLQVKEADLNFYFNDRFVGNTYMKTLIDLVAKDTTTIPLELKASAKDLLAGTVPLLLNRDVKLRIEGKVKAGRKGFFINVPVTYEGMQHITIRDSIQTQRVN